MSATAALLIVDDNEDNRYTLARRLNREGFTNLTTADNGREALDLLLSKPFDLVLLDVMMPDLNGIEVLEQLKLSPGLRNIPVIMISALGEIESVVRCIELGAEDYLPKPFNPTILRARVGATLEKKRLRDQLQASLMRLEEEMDAARKLQLGMLPRNFPLCTPERPVEVCACMEPAREVGGDLYDFFPATNKVYCFLVGDVSGKGAPAAMFMARTRSLVRMATELWPRLSAENVTPARVAEAVNRELCQDNRDRMFVTLFLGFLETGSGVLSYVNAGHVGPRLVRANGEIERLEGRPELPLGVRSNTSYKERVVTMQPGDTILVCSDGVHEAMNGADEHYGQDRLEAELRGGGFIAPAEMVHAVKAHVDAFVGSAPKADDLTMLALRWRPAWLLPENSSGPAIILG